VWLRLWQGISFAGRRYAYCFIAFADCRLGGHIEKLVDELDLALNCGLAEDAMASLDQTNDLNFFEIHHRT
jgi:hypothetical protein